MYPITFTPSLTIAVPQGQPHSIISVSTGVELQVSAESLLTFKSFCDEPLQVVHVFGVFCLGVAQDIPDDEPKQHNLDKNKNIKQKA